MEVLTTVKAAQNYLAQLRQRGQTVGLVPTMGALHQGHLSLVHASRSRCDHTVATIFVNPTQFAPGEDLEKYPRTLQADLEGLRSAGASAVFVPETNQMYPPDCTTAVQPPAISKTLEGQFRPTHFQGVATVVLKLFHILPASHAFFGQKDFQQLRVIEAMTRDLNVGIEIVSCPIVREPDGLAMSSRNRYLSDAERARALCLSRALAAASDAVAGGQRDRKAVEDLMLQQLHVGNQRGGVDSLDYAVARDSQTLAAPDRLQGDIVLLIAAHVGSTRLIDNQIMAVPNE